MMRLISILLISFLLLACDNSTFGIMGKVENNTYTNKYFNVSLALPESWHVANKSENEQNMEEGAKLISDGNFIKKLKLKFAIMRTLNLFTSSKYKLLDQDTSFSPSLMALGEQSPRFIFKKKTSDYLNVVKKGLIESGLPYSFAKSLSRKEISDLNFDILTGTIEGDGYLKVYQDYYVTKIRGFMLVFIMSYTGEEDKQIMLSSLESLKRLND